MILWLAGGLVGLLGAAVVLRAGTSGERRRPVQVAAVGAAASVAVLGATLGLMTQETRLFVSEGLTEAGHPRNQDPPLPEEAVSAAEAALAEGGTWSLTTPLGECLDDRYTFIWLQFRLHPAVPDCEGGADVRLYADVSPPRDADVIETAGGLAAVRG